MLEDALKTLQASIDQMTVNLLLFLDEEPPQDVTANVIGQIESILDEVVTPRPIILWEFSGEFETYFRGKRLIASTPAGLAALVVAERTAHGDKDDHPYAVRLYSRLLEGGPSIKALAQTHKDQSHA